MLRILANLFQNGQSLLISCHNNKLVYPPELSRIAGFCTHSNKKIYGGGPPDPPFKQNCLSLYYNHNTANHLKKLKHIQKSPSPFTIFLAKLKIKWSLYVLFEKSIADHFSRMHIWKNKEKSLKTSWKCTSKVLEKGMSWSVGTMCLTNRYWLNSKMTLMSYNDNTKYTTELPYNAFSYNIQKNICTVTIALITVSLWTFTGP